MSKFCSHCGNEILEEAVVCPKCGCMVEGMKISPNGNSAVGNADGYESGLTTCAKVFMIIGCVTSAFFWLIPLAWTIPMTVVFCNKLRDREKISTGFAVCCLLFVSLVGGILMLCNDKIMEKD